MLNWLVQEMNFDSRLKLVASQATHKIETNQNRDWWRIRVYTVSSLKATNFFPFRIKRLLKCADLAPFKAN